MSEDTSSARRCGLLAGIEPAIVSVIQRKSAPWATSIKARNAMSPSPMRQYRLRYQRGLVPSAEGLLLSGVSDPGEVEALDICGLVATTPDGEDHRRLRGVLFDLLPEPLDESVYAARGDEGFVLPDLAEQRVAREHDSCVA